MHVLPQEEIDALLAAISGGTAESEDVIGIMDQKKIKIYDFKRPDKFMKEQIRTLSAIHEDYARLLATTISQPIRTLFDVHVASMDQLTFEEFIRSVPNPTTAVVFELKPLPGYGLLEIDPILSQCLVDRLTGGSGPSEPAHREHTELEQKVLTELVQKLLATLDGAWASVKPLRSRFVRLETNPMIAAIVAREEMVALVTLEVFIGEVTGMMNLCLPALTLAPILEELRLAFSAGQVSPQKETVGLDFYSDLKVLTQVYCPIQDLSFSEVLKLKEGVLVPIPDFHSLEAHWEAGGRHLALVDLETRKLIPDTHPVITRVAPTLPELDLSAVEVQEPIETASFEFLESVDPGYFLELLKMETPQTLALILASLHPSVAGPIWTQLEKELQKEVGQRISNLQSVSPRVLGLVASVLRKNLVEPDGSLPTRLGGKEFLETLKTQGGQK